MQDVGNTIKIVFFCLYSKATPFKIPARGVILHLTPFPLFITLYFSSQCEEGKVRKLEERLCLCVQQRECRQQHNPSGDSERELTDCMYVCVRLQLTHSLHTLQVRLSTAPSLHCTFLLSDLYYRPC